MGKITDIEIQAMHTICEELSKVAMPARRRVLGYVCARLAEEDGGAPHIAFRGNGEAETAA